MGYEKSVKKSRLKDRSSDARGQSIKSWTIAASFGGSEEKKITMILTNTQTGNTFYEKHVLRRGEDPGAVFELRNAERGLRDAMAAGDTGAAERAVGLMNTGPAWNVRTSGAPASTVISLAKIDHEMMLYRFAEGLFKNRTKFMAKNQNFHVPIDMGCDCVCDFGPGRSGKFGDGLVVGAQLIADDGDKLTFDVNHCVGST